MVFSIHSQEEKIDVLGNFYWCEFHFVLPEIIRNSIFDLENGGRLIHKVDLYMSKYGKYIIYNLHKTNKNFNQFIHIYITTLWGFFSFLDLYEMCKENCTELEDM